MTPVVGNAVPVLPGSRVTLSLTAPTPRPLGAIPPSLSQSGRQYQDALPRQAITPLPLHRLMSFFLCSVRVTWGYATHCL